MGPKHPEIGNTMRANRIWNKGGYSNSVGCSEFLRCTSSDPSSALLLEDTLGIHLGLLYCVGGLRKQNSPD